MSGVLFDGRADQQRLVRVIVTAKDDTVLLPSIEDMVADRLAQYSAGSAVDTSRLEQAWALFRLADGLDIAYLCRRVRDEGGDLGLLEL